jgi:hypothetical protein
VSHLPVSVGFFIAAAITVVAALYAAVMLHTADIAAGRHAGSYTRAGTHHLHLHWLLDLPSTLRNVATVAGRPLGLLLIVWTVSMLGVNALSALYPVLMLHEFDLVPSASSFVPAARVLPHAKDFNDSPLKT